MKASLLDLALLGSLPIVLALSACTSASDDVPTEDDELIGGSETGARPEVGLLEAEGKKCTATLVGREVVLTAGACVNYKTGSIAGAKFTIENDGRRESFEGELVKSFGDGASSRTDLALVKLTTPVPSDLAKPVRIARVRPGNGELVASYGYGCVDRETKRGDGTKRRVELVAGMKTFDACASDLGGPTFRGSGTANTGMVYRVNCGTRASGEDRFADVAAHHAELQQQITAWGSVARTPPSCGEFSGTEVWTCQAGTQDRVRCIEGALERVTCATECQTKPTGANDICTPIEDRGACGDRARFTLWNCQDGDYLEKCVDGELYRADCSRGCTSQASGRNDTCNTSGTSGPTGGDLAAVVAKIGQVANAVAPGTTFGFAVRDLQTGETASFNGNAKIVSASSAKAIWMAVGVKDTSIEACEPHAYDTFVRSGDFEVAKVMDKLSSFDRINTFMWNEAGMPNSGFCTWHRANGSLQIANNCPGGMGRDNYFTALDTVEFMTRIWNGSLLSAEKKKWILDWMTKSHREGFGAWIVNPLPEWTQPTVHHKPGWLSPANFPDYAISNDIGIVEIGGGKAYAISTLSSGVPDVWTQNNRQTPMLEYASCVVFHAMTRDVADPFASCWHP